MTVHFLHIGKTGGTALRDALRPVAELYGLEFHKHQTTLKDIPQGEKVVFFLRDPLSRFVSGFYSRQRKGAPRYRSPWSLRERLAFSAFKSPNELGKALSSTSLTRRWLARHAMASIQHIRERYTFWLGSPSYLRSRSNDIFLVGFQDTLADDLAQLRSLIGIREEISLPSDPVRAHRNPPTLDRSLSELAERNLRVWYQDDCRLYEIIRNQGLSALDLMDY